MKTNGYKTVIFNGLVAAIPVLDYVLNNGAIIGPALGPHGAAILGALGVVNIGLRAITDTPMGKQRRR